MSYTSSVIDDSESMHNISTNRNEISINNVTVVRRSYDGYVNANQLCKACNIDYYIWRNTKKSSDYVSELSMYLSTSIDDLVICAEDESNNKQIWIHPRIAINMAQSVSMKVDILVSHWLTTEIASFDNSKSNKTEDIDNDVIISMQSRIDRLQEGLQAKDDLLYEQRNAIDSLSRDIHTKNCRISQLEDTIDTYVKKLLNNDNLLSKISSQLMDITNIVNSTNNKVTRLDRSDSIASLQSPLPVYSNSHVFTQPINIPLSSVLNANGVSTTHNVSTTPNISTTPSISNMSNMSNMSSMSSTSSSKSRNRQDSPSSQTSVVSSITCKKCNVEIRSENWERHIASKKHNEVSKKG